MVASSRSKLVLDLPDKLFEDVLYGDQAFHTAPLVYDDCHLELALLELAEHLLYRFVLRHDETFSDQRADVEFLRALAGGAEKVFDVYGAEDVIQVPFVDRITGEAPEGRRLRQLFQERVARQSLDVRPRDHDLAGYLVCEVEDVVEVVALFGVQLPRGGG